MGIFVTESRRRRLKKHLRKKNFLLWVWQIFSLKPQLFWRAKIYRKKRASFQVLQSIRHIDHAFLQNVGKLAILIAAGHVASEKRYNRHKSVYTAEVIFTYLRFIMFAGREFLLPFLDYANTPNRRALKSAIVENVLHFRVKGLVF